jgi:hypothetical protein
MEGLERVIVLAKQVLSQLSYTPTVGIFILKHFQNHFTFIRDRWRQAVVFYFEILRVSETTIGVRLITC